MTPAKSPPRYRVVVDGSNLATEGRTIPSLEQLDEAVRSFVEEHPNAEVIVVADATFEHRVAPTERARFKEAELAAEIVTPPAGAVGRGDGFILKIAARIDAVVLSNDSFQEFHDDYPWLFDEGRLIGGKPVPSVGWVFTPRLPVRGVKSPRAAKKLTVALPPGVKPTIGATITPAKAPVAKTTKVPAARATKTTKKATTKSGTKVATKTAELPPKATKVAKSPLKKAPTKHHEPKKVAAEVDLKKSAKARPAKAAASLTPPAVALRRGRQPVNPEVDFSRFVAAHRVRSQVSGEVVAFTSHGAIIAVDLEGGSRVECYAPTTSLGSPPPARARDALARGDVRTFRLVSVDRDRRIAELSLP